MIRSFVALSSLKGMADAAAAEQLQADLVDEILAAKEAFTCAKVVALAVYRIARDDSQINIAESPALTVAEMVQNPQPVRDESAALGLNGSGRQLADISSRLMNTVATSPTSSSRRNMHALHDS
ncbi:hypothetical protein WJX84_001245 [Apatococcus fuscideae]|uniref:Uncharacterized protein n=1 Tax=Apatococcus fuscideae TaxID=2026836 RepID=A0AAW1RM93_9CHLO